MVRCFGKIKTIGSKPGFIELVTLKLWGLLVVALLFWGTGGSLAYAAAPSVDPEDENFDHLTTGFE